MTKNLTLLCSVSVFQSQGPLHVFIVWQKTSLRCAQFQCFNPKSCYMFPWYDKKLHFAALSFSVSIPSPITCFHSMTKNITSLCSVSVFQSQVPLHVFIVWQKTSLHCAQFQCFNPKSRYMFPWSDKKLHFTVLSFSVSIPSPVTCFHSMTKNFTSLCSVSVFQSQVPLHVSIVWQNTSLRCAQFQFFNPKSHYMFP